VVTESQAGAVRRPGIRRMLFLLLLIVVIPILVVQAGIYYTEYQSRRAHELETNLEVARIVAMAFNGHIRDLRRQESAIGEALLRLAPFTQEQATAFLIETARQYPDVQSLSWADARGRVQASSVAPLVGRDVGQTPWFREIQSGRGWEVSNVARNKAAHQATFIVAQAIGDASGALRGTIAAAVDPEGLRSVLGIKRSGGGMFGIVDGSGWLVYRYPTMVPWADRDWRARYQITREALAGREGSGAIRGFFENEKGLTRLVGQTPIPSIGWVASASTPEREAVGPILLSLTRNAGILVLVGGFALLVGSVVAGRITRPVLRLREQALELGRGRLDRRIEPLGPAELGDLAEAFNRMAGELQARERERAGQARLLEAIVENSRNQLVYLDRDFNFLWVNPAYAEACQRPREQFAGHNHFDFYPHEENEAIFRRVRDTGRPVEFREKPFVFPDHPEWGVTYWDWTLTPIKGDAGEVEGLVFSLTDMTEQVRARERIAQAEQERVRVAETMAAEINHRMKNNLTLVAGMVQLQLLAQPLQSPVAEVLGQVMTRILSLSAVHEQLYEARAERVELADGLRRVGEIAASALSKAGVAVAVSGGPIYASSKVGSALAVVANELITNAIKHGAPEADGRLRIEIGLSRSAEKVLLRIWNSGTPVSADFDVARQQGMGLRVAREIITAQLQGSLRLRPEREGTVGEIVLDDSVLTGNSDDEV